MVLKFKEPTNDLKKVMVYGLDGSGKSTFAANYCKEHGLNPVVIDIDDTNRTTLYSQGRVLDVNMRTDKSTFSNIKKTIEEIKDTEFDTIIIDGVTSLLEMLTSDARGLAKYSDRASRFQKILQALLDSRKHIIFIGQIDMEVIFTEEFQSPKAVIKVNSMVNEKYLCLVDDKGNYTYEVKKFRTVEPVPEESVPTQKKQEKIPEPQKEPKEQPKKEVPKTAKKSEPQTDFMSAGEIGEPNPADDPLRGQCQIIKDMLVDKGAPVHKFSMKITAENLIKEGVIPKESKEAILDYIDKHCPEELD